MLISLKEYGDLHGIKQDSVKRGVLRGKYKTAQKIGRNWVIDSEEPHTDNRKAIKKEGQ